MNQTTYESVLHDVEEFVGSQFAVSERAGVVDYLERTAGLTTCFDPSGLRDAEGMSVRDVVALNDLAHNWTARIRDLTLVNANAGHADSAAFRSFANLEAESLLAGIDLLGQCALQMLTGRRGMGAAWLRNGIYPPLPRPVEVQEPYERSHS